MARKARNLPKNRYIYITSLGNTDGDIFKNHEDYMFFLRLIKRYIKRYNITIYHYCVLPKEVHLILKIGEVTSNISLFMLSGRYIEHVPRMYAIVGIFATL